MGRRRRSPLLLMALLPMLIVFAVLSMVGLTLSGAGAPPNEQANQEQSAAAAAQVAAACGGNPAAQPAAASGAVTAAAAPPDPAIVQAQGVALSARQVTVALSIAQVGTKAKVSTRQVAAALLAGYVASQLNPTAAGGLFGSTAPGVTLSTEASITAFYAGLAGGKVDNPAIALSDAVAQNVKSASASALKPFEVWAMNLAGYLTTGQSLVNVAAGKVQCIPAAAAAGPGGGVFDPGNIASDAVFYNAAAMTERQVRDWISRNACAGAGCLPGLRMSTTSQPADQYCKGYTGGNTQDAATIIYGVSAACGINPQVMLVTLEKESQGVTRASTSGWAAAWGWHCPDTGPGGAANCDASHGGFFNQAYGMAKQWRRYVVDSGKYNYHAGQTANILWNVAQSGCGSAPVRIANNATAGLYDYTPYQPNAAALANFPGVGDRCSAYGNRNFFFMFGKWFGSTGGGTQVPSAAVGGSGVNIVLPGLSPVQGIVKAPNERAATVIRAALSQIGGVYSFAGGDASGPTIGQSGLGFDCSGLMTYAFAKIGVQLPRYSGAEAGTGPQRPFASAKPGDLLFWGSPIHHVAMYLGMFNGVPYRMEAPATGIPLRVSPVRLTGDWLNIAVTPNGSGW